MQLWTAGEAVVLPAAARSAKFGLSLQVLEKSLSDKLVSGGNDV